MVLPSGCAFTSIVTPLPGILLVILTVSGKVGPGAGGCTVLAGGSLVTVIVGSEQPPPLPLLLLQYWVVTNIMAAAKMAKVSLFILFAS